MDEDVVANAVKIDCEASMSKLNESSEPNSEQLTFHRFQFLLHRTSPNRDPANFRTDLLACFPEVECERRDSDLDRNAFEQGHKSVFLYGRLCAYLSFRRKCQIQAVRDAVAVAQASSDGYVTFTDCPLRRWVVKEVASQARAEFIKALPFQGFSGVSTNAHEVVHGNVSKPTGRCVKISHGQNHVGKNLDCDYEEPRCILCGVTGASNVGSVYRVMACLKFKNLLHVGGHALLDLETPSGENHITSRKCVEHRRMLANATSRGCDVHVNYSYQTTQEFLTYLESHGPKADQCIYRDPIVVLETSVEAESIHSFNWPRRCQIMVGGESHGVPQSVLKRLRPGFDHIVMIPMPGPHRSLNVAMALGMAAFSYRGKWN